MSKLTMVMAAVCAAALSACGGGTSASHDDAPPPRGTLVYGQLAGNATQAQVDAGTKASGVQALTGLAQCNVDVRYVSYMTRDPSGQPATASAGVLVPTGSGAACQGPRPVLLYAHGTTTQKSFNMADVVNNQEAALVMAMYAAQGFIVVAPNYLGYERSSLPWHPYLIAEAQAVDMVDGLRAANAHLSAAGVQTSGKLMLAGYSEGGYVSMATHKIIERDYASEFTVTAATHMSGPYNLVGFGDAIVNVQPNAGATIFLPLMLTGYQKTYGNVYNTPSDAYQSPFDQSAETLFPTDTPVATLMATGKMPADPTFTNLFGSGGLLKPSFKTSYPTSGMRTDLQTNTLLGWTPKRPTTLCGGQMDPTVFYAVNTSAMAADLKSRNAPLLGAYDLENLATLPAGVSGQTVYYGFQQAKAAVVAGGGNVQAQYHGMVAPFCEVLSRGFFQQVLASGL